jgi:hypothetical protein
LTGIFRATTALSISKNILLANDAEKGTFAFTLKPFELVPLNLPSRSKPGVRVPMLLSDDGALAYLGEGGFINVYELDSGLLVGSLNLECGK